MNLDYKESYSSQSITAGSVVTIAEAAAKKGLQVMHLKTIMVFLITITVNCPHLSVNLKLYSFSVPSRACRWLLHFCFFFFQLIHCCIDLCGNKVIMALSCVICWLFSPLLFISLLAIRKSLSIFSVTQEWLNVCSHIYYGIHSIDKEFDLAYTIYNDWFHQIV